MCVCVGLTHFPWQHRIHGEIDPLPCSHPMEVERFMGPGLRMDGEEGDSAGAWGDAITLPPGTAQPNCTVAPMVGTLQPQPPNKPPL